MGDEKRARAFRSQTRWSSARPQSLVVCCSDGRFHAQMNDFVRDRAGERSDLVAVPGGPIVVDPWTSSFDEARVFGDTLRFFVEHHDLRDVWLIAHEGCAYYRKKHPHLDAQAIRGLQERDLFAAMRTVAHGHPHYVVHSVFAALEADEVVFHVLASSTDGRS